MVKNCRNIINKTSNKFKRKLCCYAIYTCSNINIWVKIQTHVIVNPNTIGIGASSNY